MVLNILTFVVLIVLVALVGFIVVFLGTLPGKIARGRSHPQADAINVASWLGIVMGGLLWPFALIWAYYRPKEQAAGASSEKHASLESRVDDLEEQVRKLGGTP